MSTILDTLNIQPRRAAPAISDPYEPASANATPNLQRSLRMRIGVLLGILAFPAMAAPGDFGAVAGAAPQESESVSRELAKIPAMPFERPGMSFPGSAFYYLADPPRDALIALPTADPLDAGAEQGRNLGALIDPGPAAKPFFASGAGLSQARAAQCLAQAIWYEAASESEAGQRAVAQVVLNRVAHPAWPSSVCGVVYQGSGRSTGCQFTFTCDGSLSRKAGGTSWRRAQTVATEALSGSVYAPIGHATHYHTLWVNPGWAARLDHIGTIGAHRFYRNRGSGGQKAAFNSGYAGAEPGVWSASASLAPVAPAPSISVGTQAPRIGYDVPKTDAPDARLAPAAPVSPAYGAAGAVKAEYARAGQWKKRPAKASDNVAAQPAAPAPIGEE